MESKFEFLSIGMKLGIAKINDDKTSYPSQVLEIIEPDELIISGPMKKGQLVLLHEGEEIEVSYFVENRGRYSFTAKVISRDLKRIYTLRIKIISSIKKIQLRNYFRIPVTLELEKCYILTKSEDKEVLIEKCEIKDISGGGMRLHCNYKHEIGDEIQWKFKIKDDLVEGKAKVVRIEEVDTFNYKYSIGVSFTDITEYNRDLIIKYIFEQQRILRLKGLI